MDFPALGQSSATVAVRKVVWRNLYAHWYYRGFRSIVSLQCTTVTNLLFSIVLSSLLLLTDWPRLFIECGGAACQGSIWHYVSNLTSNLFVACFIALYMGYCCYVSLRGALRTYEASVIKESLVAMGITQKEVSGLTWNELVRKVVATKGGGCNLTEEEIAATIMRSENWLVAMIRDGRVIDLTLPWNDNLAVVAPSPHLVLTKTVEFALSFTVLQFIYDQGSTSRGGGGEEGGGGGREELEAEVGTVYKGGFEYQPLLSTEPAPLEDEEEHSDEEEEEEDGDSHVVVVSPTFMAEPRRLKFRFLAVGIVLLFLLPFMSLYMSMQFVLDNLTEWHHNSSYLGPRVISPLYSYQIREYNELPHQLERRVNRATALASEFITHPYFASPTLTHITQSVEYISGSIVAVLLLLSLVGDNILLSLTLSAPQVEKGEEGGPRNLLWALTVFSAVYAASRSLRSTPPSISVNTADRSTSVDRKGKEGRVGREEEESDPRKQQQRQCQALLQEWRRICEGQPGRAINSLTLDGLSASSSLDSPSPVSQAQAQEDKDKEKEWAAVEQSHLWFYRERLQSLFPHRLHLFLQEIFSALHTPLLLLFVLGTDQVCERIARFVAMNKVATHRCGEVFYESAPVVATKGIEGSNEGASIAGQGQGQGQGQRRDDASIVESQSPQRGREGEEGKGGWKEQGQREERESNLRSQRSLLRSVLLEQNIEYTDDPYWRERMVQD